MQAEIARQATDLSRCEMIEGSLANRSGIVVVESLEQAVELANEYAAEHLCLLTAQPWDLIGQIRNAGGIFVGEESFEVLGDYVAGPSHIMPTSGTARFASPVSVADFVKITSLIALSRAELSPAGAGGHPHRRGGGADSPRQCSARPRYRTGIECISTNGGNASLVDMIDERSVCALEIEARCPNYSCDLTFWKWKSTSR